MKVVFCLKRREYLKRIKDKNLFHKYYICFFSFGCYNPENDIGILFLPDFKNKNKIDGKILNRENAVCYVLAHEAIHSAININILNNEEKIIEILQGKKTKGAEISI